jgi:hypothetical protein
MKPGAGTTATSYKLQATSFKLQATSFKLDIKVLITRPEGPRQNEKKLRQIDAGQYVMLTAKLTQEPGILTQASSDKLRQSASLKQNLPVREYLFNKSNKKDKKNGTNIRLHKHRYGQLEQGRSQCCRTFLLDDDVHRSRKNNGEKQNGYFIPNRISPGAGDGSLDSQTNRERHQKNHSKINWLQMQCRRKIYCKIYEQMDEELQVQNPGQNEQKITSIKISLSGIRGHWPRIFLIQLELRQIVTETICLERETEEKATSHKPQATSTRNPDSSIKRQAKIFFLFIF